MDINWDEIRKEQFPVFENVVHLKAAGGSPMSKAAFKEGIKYFQELHRRGDIFWDKYFIKLEETRRMVAEYLNSDSNEIAFLVNTSSGINAIARLLKKEDIIYPDGEFPSSIHIFKLLGFKTEKIEAQVDNSYSIDNIQNKIKSSTKYLIHSHVQYLTGFRQDLDKLGNLCEKKKIKNIINATQSFGAFPLDVKNQKIDMLAASGLKWACCGYGIGILYINNRYLINEELPFSSWLSVSDAFSINNDNLNIIKKTKSMDGYGGTPNFPALLALKGGLSLIEDIGKGKIKIGIEKIKERIIFLTSVFIGQVQNLGFKIISPLNLKNRSGIITIEHDRAELIFNRLLSKKIYISLRNYQGSKEKKLLRFSFNYYNNLDDIDRAINILKEFK